MPHICANIWYLFFSFWLTSLHMTDTRSIHVSTDDSVSFLFMGEQYSTVYMYHVFICSSLEEHFNCFHVLTIVNSAAVKIRVQSAWVFLTLGFSGYSFHSYPLPSFHGFLRIGVVDVNGIQANFWLTSWPKAAPGLYAWSHWGEPGLDLGLALILWQQHPTTLGGAVPFSGRASPKLSEEGAVEPCSGHITLTPVNKKERKLICNLKLWK